MDTNPFFDISPMQIHDYSRMALERLKSESLPATPENYAVWFSYYAGVNPQLNSAIDILAKSKKDFTAERCIDLYEHFVLGHSVQNLAISDIGERMQTAMTEIMRLMNTAGERTQEFSSNLNSTSQKLASEIAVDSTTRWHDLRAIVSQMVIDSREMVEQNNALRGELDKSAKELNDMRRDLVSTRQEALQDALTTITNRKGFDIRFLESAAEATQNDTPLSLLMVDIDFFKRFNDTYGHQAGDQILRLVGQTLVNCIKGQDIAARYGGEEFAIILPQTTIQNATRVGEVLRQAIANKEVTNKNTKEKLGQITISVGVTQYRPHESLTDCIERADIALYTAKHNGRNRVEVNP